VSADTNKLQRIQQKFAVFSSDRFFLHAHYRSVYALEQLKLHTILKRKYHLDALLLIQVCVSSKL
jgi:hypothetical protein